MSILSRLGSKKGSHRRIRSCHLKEAEAKKHMQRNIYLEAGSRCEILDVRYCFAEK